MAELGLTEDDYMKSPVKHIVAASRSLVSETEDTIYGKIDDLLTNLKTGKKLHILIQQDTWATIWH